MVHFVAQAAKPSTTKPNPIRTRLLRVMICTPGILPANYLHAMQGCLREPIALHRAVVNETTSSSAPTVENRPVELDLFVASFLALFLEVLLIRWLPSYERVLAYFTNFVLIAAFLGLGLGALLVRRGRRWIRWQPLLILGVVTIGIMFNQYVKTGSVSGDVYYSDFGRSAPVWLLVPECLAFFFFLVALVFIPLGQQIGTDLQAVAKPLRGYIINILGSLTGVLAFTVISLIGAGPWWWFAIAMLGCLWFVRQEKATCVVNVVIGIVVIAVVWLAGEMYWWTPYNKVTVRTVVENARGELEPGDGMVRRAEISQLVGGLGFSVAVNDDFFQQPIDLSPPTVAAHSNLLPIVEHYEFPYNIPEFPHEDVLVVGAGTGNDVAAALRRGAERVDAVEIDPGLLELGRIAHPEQPYRDQRVHVYVDDARSFFSKTDRRYNLVVFGLLDAHHLFSSMSSVRLDSFVYTVESFQEVRQLLKPDGIVMVQHALGNPYLDSRMYAMLTEAFGVRPYVADPKGSPTFFAGPGVAKFIAKTQTAGVTAVSLATDDWPFFYLRSHALSPEYRYALETMALIALVCLLAVSQGRMNTIHGHFFFLGAAFLLIETVSVTRFALLFGSTWVVNSIAFSMILLVILVANLCMNRLASVNTHLLYSLLAIAVAANYTFPIHTLLSLKLGLRLLVAMTLMGSPIFFAAFIFARSYKQTPAPDLAFASNLLGAVCGGLIEYSSLIIGFRHLLLIGFGLYALSYAALLLPARRVAAAS